MVLVLTSLAMRLTTNRTREPLTESNIENVAVFEFIPWILSQCATVDEAKERLKFINLTNTQFNEMFPCANLHWIIADKESLHNC